MLQCLQSRNVLYRNNRGHRLSPARQHHAFLLDGGTLNDLCKLSLFFRRSYRAQIPRCHLPFLYLGASYSAVPLDARLGEVRPRYGRG
jgi:hypothetical protein